MDFESRDFLWTTFQNEVNKSVSQSTGLCKTCIALEILKLSVCAGDCLSCEENLFSLFEDLVTPTHLNSHLKSLKQAILQSSQIEELEKKLPLYQESQNSVVSLIEQKVQTLEGLSEKLAIENKELKKKISLLQGNWMESLEVLQKFDLEIQTVKKIQKEIERKVQRYFEESRIIWEAVVESFKFQDFQNKVEKIDDKLLEEFQVIDQLAEDVKIITDRVEDVKSDQKELKDFNKHCANLDYAVEQVLEFHHKIYDLNKSAEEKLKGLNENFEDYVKIEKVNAEYKSSLLHMRKQTSETFLNRIN
jgi:DNA repair exonuclease SbcCD ATPase subunit